MKTLNRIRGFLSLFLSLFIVNAVQAQGPGLVPFTCDGELYQTFNPSGSFQFVNVSTSPVVFTTISNLSISNINSIGYNTEDNLIYGINRFTRELIRIDANGTLTNLGLIAGLPANSSGFYAGGMDLDGNLYVTGSASAGLYKIDISTQSATFIGTPGVNCADIAFNPVDGFFYGWGISSNFNRLIRIDPTNGALTNIGTGNNGFAGMGAAYFDASGQLFAYGQEIASGSGQKTFVTIDINTGVITALGNGPTVSLNDGCSCSANIEFEKQTSEDSIYVCSTDKAYTYTFSVFNASGAPLSNVSFSDGLTNGLLWNSEPISITSGLQIAPTSITGSANANFTITSIPEGASSFTIDVLVPACLQSFEFKNQATLSGLPAILGQTVVSDNPDTGVIDDSTTTNFFGDMTPPTINGVPADLTVSCEALIPAPPVLSATDSCDTNVNVVFSEVQNGSGCGAQVVRTWSATDNCGNTATATQVITVIDSIPPTISCPVDITAEVDTNSCSASSVDLGIPTTDDNCGVVSVTNDAPSTFPLGTTVVTWTVLDDCGNTASCTQSVTVLDNENPTIICPADLTADVDQGICSASNVDLGTPAVNDNCSVASITNDAPSTFPLGTTTVTWTVTDGSGNVATCVQLVTVEDNEAPSISCPMDLTADVDAGSCSATNVDIGNPTVDDNCSVASVTNDAPTTFPVGTTTVTWTVTDGSGNTATCTQNVTVVDNEVPTITCPSDLSADVDSNACSASNIDLGTPTTNDNCTAITVTNDAPASFPIGTTTVTWTVTDGSGNSASCTQIVTVVDNENPKIACPTDLTVDVDTGICSASNVDLGTPVANDNCSVASISNDAPSTFPLGTTTVTWTVTDGAGNSASCTQIVTIVDTESPVAICQDLTITLDEFGQASIIAADIDGGSTDNCGIQSITISQTDFGCADVGTNTVTLTVTDESGNVTTCEATVTVEEENFVEIVCPGDQTYDCTISCGNSGAYVSWDEPTASSFTSCDNGCDPNTYIPGFIYMGEFNGNRYYCSNSSNYTWQAANIAATNAGGYLATIQSAQENQFIRSQIMANYAWIGFTDQNVEGNFEWSNGENVNYTNWAYNEPNNNGPGGGYGYGGYCGYCGPADYTVIRASNGRWYDRRQCNKHEFVMEIPCGNPITITQISGPSNGTVLVGGTTEVVTYVAIDSLTGATDTCSFTITVDECVPVYCNSAGSCTAYEWIDHVSLGTINNTSGNDGGYGDYTALSTDAMPGDVINFTLTPGFSGSSYTEAWRIWVDWNYDGDFYDQGELVYQGYGSSTLNGSFTVPMSAAGNNLRVRVSMRWNCFAGPCSHFYYGEVEDYTLNETNPFKSAITVSNDVNTYEDVIDDKEIGGIGLELKSLYPNPILSNSKFVTLDVRSAQDADMQVNIVDLSGQLVKQDVQRILRGKNACKLDVQGMAKGTYLIEVVSNGLKETISLIIQ